MRFSPIWQTVSAAAMLAFPSVAMADVIGEERIVDGPTYGAAANWNEAQVAQPAVWQLPDGWVVTGYIDVRTSDYGRTSLNVSYAQAGGSYASQAQIASQFDSAINVAVQYGAAQYAAFLGEKQATEASAASRFQTSHNTISVTATARGSGNFFDRRGASIHGKLRLVTRFVGTQSSVAASAQSAITIAQRGVRGITDWGYPDARQFVDVNGDGIADFCRLVGDAPHIYASCQLGRPDGSFTPNRVNTPSDGFDLGYEGTRVFIDANGDGRADFCRTVGDGANRFTACNLSNGASFDPSWIRL